MATLTKVLEGSRVRLECQTHFGNLIRDYSEMGQIEEASLITRFWSETQTVSTDDRVVGDYLREFLRKYAGRGIPEILDLAIATRVTGMRGTGGVTAEQLRDVMAVAKAAKNEVIELKREISSLKSEIRRAPKGPGGGDKEQRGPQCHKCGEFGHIARNCTNKDKKASDDDEAKGSDE